MKQILNRIQNVLDKAQLAQIKGGYWQMGPCSTTCSFGDAVVCDCNPCGAISDNQPSTVGRCYCGVEGDETSSKSCPKP
jgi:hypothetical protein